MRPVSKNQEGPACRQAGSVPLRSLGEGGFTLIETLIYIALLALVLGASIFGAYSVIGASSQSDTDVFIEEEANFVLRKISWVLSGVDTINAPAGGGTGDTLSVDKAGYGANPLVITISAGNITLSEGGGAAIVLNSESAPADGLVFEHIIGTTLPSVEATVTMDGRQFSISRNIRQ